MKNSKLQTLKYFLIFLLPASVIAGQVTCSPSSCTPPCDGSCTYYTCDTPGSSSESIDSLPYNVPTPDAAYCELDSSGLSGNELPIVIQGNSYDELPVNVTIEYKTCTPHTRTGPACPPPAPDPIIPPPGG